LFVQAVAVDSRLQFRRERPVPNNFAPKLPATISQRRAGVDQYIESFFVDQPPNRENQRRRRRLRWLELVAIDSIIDPVHTGSGIRKTITQLIGGEITHRNNDARG